MITWAAWREMPGICSSRATAASTGASGCRPARGPVEPSGSMPWAAGIAVISSPIRVVRVSICALRASIWASKMAASSPWSSYRDPLQTMLTRAAPS
jgi:hypothetical protein